MNYFTTCLYWYLITVLIILFLDGLILLCPNARFRYYACYFGYMSNTSAIALLYLPLLPFMMFGNLNIYFTSLPTKILSKILGIEWELRGLKNLHKNQAAIVTITHQTMFDVLGLFVMGSTLRNVIAVARKALFYVWPLGPIFWLSGAVVFIDNQTKQNRTMETLTTVLDRVKKHKMKMIFFPEGTRNLNGKTLLPFKKGAFRLAIEFQVPIVPIVFSPYYFINLEEKLFHKGKIIISILPPIPTQGTTMADMVVLQEKTQAIMEAEYQNLKLEVEPAKYSSVTGE